MYHCHFEDVEHVQMGMAGIVFVRPAQGPKFAYNDASTAFDREFTLLLNEVDPRPHDNLLDIQEFLWSDYKPPTGSSTAAPIPTRVKATRRSALARLTRRTDPGETLRQPVSSLIQVNAGERVLLRFVNLGYEQQSMQLTGIPMRVVGEDATLLRGPARRRPLLHHEHHLHRAGRSARRAVHGPAVRRGRRGPPFAGARTYNSYLLQNRNVHTLNNNGATVKAWAAR